MLIVRRAGFALAGLLACVSPSAALEVDVEVGLGGHLVADTWAPVQVTVTLGEDEPPLTGQVVLERPRQAVSTCAAPIEVAPGERATVFLAAPVGLASQDYRVEVLDAAGERLTSVTPAETWNLLGDDQQLVVLVGRPSLQALRGERDLLPRLAHLPPGRVPREPRALRGAAAVCLKGDRSAELRELAEDPAAIACLRQDVLEGGQLIVFADQHEPTPFWTGTLLAELLPVVRVRGQLQLGPRALESELGVAPDEPVWSLDALQAPGATPPPVISRALGLGRVALVTVDVDQPALRGLNGTTGFLARLVRRPPRTTPRLRDEALSEVSARAFAATPTLSALALSLLLLGVIVHLLALGPLTGWVTRRRSAWAGLAIPPVASLLLAGVILLIAALTRGPGRAQSLIYTFQDPDRAQAWSQLDLGLFAGASDDFEVELGPHLRPRPQRRPRLDALRFRRPEPTLRFSEGRPVSVGPVYVPARGHTWLELDAIVERDAAPPALTPPPLVALRRSLDPDAEWPVFELRHDGAGRLRHVLLVAVGISETRVGLVELVGGEPLAWRPESGALLGEVPPLEASPFEHAAGRRALLLDLAQRLERERHRAAAATSPLERVAFPAYWAVVLRPVDDPALVVRDARGAELAPRQLQAAFFPVQELP